MQTRKRFPERDPHIADCQVSGDEGVVLVEYKGTYMIPEIKAERLRQDFRPTPMEVYEDWKEDFDRWTGT